MSTLSSLSDMIVILIMVSLTKSGYNTRTRALFTVTKQFSNLSQVKFLSFLGFVVQHFKFRFQFDNKSIIRGVVVLHKLAKKQSRRIPVHLSLLAV